MVAGGHRIIAKDALKLVESLSHTTPTHGQTLVTYTSTDNRTTSTVVDGNRYNHRTESAGSTKEPTNFLIYTACCCSASNLTFHAYTHHQLVELTVALAVGPLAWAMSAEVVYIVWRCSLSTCCCCNSAVL